MNSTGVRFIILTCLNGHSFGVPEEEAHRSHCSECGALPLRADVQLSIPSLLKPGYAVFLSAFTFLVMVWLLRDFSAGIYVLLTSAVGITYFLSCARRRSIGRPASVSIAALHKTIQFFYTVCAVCLLLTVFQFWVNHVAGRIDDASSKSRLLEVRELLVSWHGLFIESKLALIITLILLLVLLTCFFLPSLQHWASKVLFRFKLITDILVHAFVVVSMFGVGVSQVGSALEHSIKDATFRSKQIDEVYYRLRETIERNLLREIAANIYQAPSSSCLRQKEEAGEPCAKLRDAVNEHVALLRQLDSMQRLPVKASKQLHEDLERANERMRQSAVSPDTQGKARAAHDGAPETSTMSGVTAQETKLKEEDKAKSQFESGSTDEAFAEAVSESLKVTGDGGLKSLLAPFIGSSPFFEVLLHLADETVVAAVREKSAEILLRLNGDPNVNLVALIKGGGAAISNSNSVQRVKEKMYASAMAYNRKISALLSKQRTFVNRSEEQRFSVTPTPSANFKSMQDDDGDDPIIMCVCIKEGSGKEIARKEMPSSRCQSGHKFLACPFSGGAK